MSAIPLRYSSDDCKRSEVFSLHFAVGSGTVKEGAGLRNLRLSSHLPSRGLAMPRLITPSLLAMAVWLGPHCPCVPKFSHSPSERGPSWDQASWAG